MKKWMGCLLWLMFTDVFASSETLTPVSFGQMSLNIGFMLIVLALILLGVLFFLKKWPQLNTRDMTIVRVFPMGVREKLMLVHIGKEYFLLGVTSHQIQLIHHYGETPPFALTEGDQTQFGAVLKKMMGKKNES